MNVVENRMHFAILAIDLATGKQKVLEITALFPFLIGMSKEEKSHYQGIDVENKEWVDQCINEMNADSSFLPGYLSVAAVQQDFKLFNDLESLRVMVEALLAKLSDTQFAAGAEAYAACLLYYMMVRAAAKAGVPGAQAIYDRLKVRFINQGNHTPTPPTP